MNSTSSFRRLQATGLAAATLLMADPAKSQPPYTLDVPYVPSPDQTVDTMLRMGDVGPNDYLIDLGSGDGRIAIAAVQERKARGALGVDIDAERVAEARSNARNAGVTGQVEFRQQDLFKTDFSQATVLTMYLLAEVNLKLRPVILDQLKPGTRVVSHAFDMGEWEPDASEEFDGRVVHAWIVPAKVAGRWQADGPAGPFALTLAQSFQKIHGSAEIKGKTLPIGDATLTGDRLRFTLDGQRYVGAVQGDRIAAVAGDGAAPDWHAQR